MLADDLLSHFVLGSTYHVKCLGFVTVSTFFSTYLKLPVWFISPVSDQTVSDQAVWSEIQKAS